MISPTANSFIPGARATSPEIASLAFLTPGVAKRVAGTALLLGVTADALLRDGPFGLAFPLWVAFLALNLVTLSWRAERRVRAEGAAWLAAAVLAATALAWRNSPLLSALNVLGTAGCLGLAAVSLRDPHGGLFARRLRDAFVAGVRQILEIAFGPVRLLTRDSHVEREVGRVARVTRPLASAVAIGLVVILIFGSLLRSADPIFASLVSLPAIQIDTVVSHVAFVGFFTWLVAGWARGALVDDARPFDASPLPLRLSTLDITVGLGALVVLLGAFIATQLGWFFGGESFLQARTGLTVSAYARRGFFELVWVTTLAIPLILVTRATIRRDDLSLRRRHTVLSAWLIGLLAAVSLSAVLRFKLYVHYYGFTVERIYPLAFIAWLAFLLVWIGMTVLRERDERFVAGTLVSAFLTLLTLNLGDPDAFVARANIARASRLGASAGAPSERLDIAHLATLAGGAVPMAVDALLASSNSALTPDDHAQRCGAARALLKQWGPESERRAAHAGAAGWRFLNHDDAIALRAVDPHAAELRRISETECPAKSDGDQR